MTIFEKKCPPLVQAVCASVVLASFVGVTSSFAQSQQQRDNEYQQFIRPQIDRYNADVAAINARPGLNEGSSPSNYYSQQSVPMGWNNFGALAFYAKSPGVYGYVFESGYSTEEVAIDLVDTVCKEKSKTCTDFTPVSNGWMIVASINKTETFLTGRGATQQEATAVIQDYCIQTKITCTVRDAFDVTAVSNGVPADKGIQAVR
jgi:hypothetical protein